LTQHATTPRLILDAPTRRLLDTVEADPLAVTTVGIPAPGGYGKTTVLAELARVYRAARHPGRRARRFSAPTMRPCCSSTTPTNSVRRNSPS